MNSNLMITSPLKVGIIGCGTISDAYLKGCKTFPGLEVIHLADIDPARTAAKALEFGIPRHGTANQLLEDEEVALVINLTIPRVHREVNEAIVRAGKHLYCEKPFGINRSEAGSVLAEAAKQGVRVGSAPDTFLGQAHQACRHLIDEGRIGKPLSAVAFMVCPGHERWHPNPAFYYDIGGGPMFDMGPYYLTALVNLLGPMRRVSGSTGKGFADRVITSQPLAGTRIEVKTPTHFAGTIDFCRGAIATVIMSFDVWHSTLPRIEIHGSEGSLLVPDPNCSEGEVLLRRSDDPEWRSMPMLHPLMASRGAGVADMAQAIAHERPHRASGALALHVIDAMQAFEESSTQEIHRPLATHCEQPAPLPPGVPVGLQTNVPGGNRTHI